MKSAHKTLKVFAIFDKWTLWIEKLLGFSLSSVPPEKKRTDCTFQSAIEICAALRFF